MPSSDDLQSAFVTFRKEIKRIIRRKLSLVGMLLLLFYVPVSWFWHPIETRWMIVRHYIPWLIVILTWILILIFPGHPIKRFKV